MGSKSGSAPRPTSTAPAGGEIWHVDGVAMALRDEAYRLSLRFKPVACGGAVGRGSW
jgi:hypothetical protein